MFICMNANFHKLMNPSTRKLLNLKFMLRVAIIPANGIVKFNATVFNKNLL